MRVCICVTDLLCMYVVSVNSDPASAAHEIRNRRS